MLHNTRPQASFINILGSDGTFRKTVDKDNPRAVRREIELKDKTKMTKYELVYDTLDGNIVALSFFDGKFGRNLFVTFDDGHTLSLNTSSNFCDDLLKKLPNLDLEKEVTLKPYSSTDDTGKNRRGLTIYQDNEKVENYFYDAEKKKSINGFPEPEGKTDEYDKDDWKIHFMRVHKFLAKYAEENIIPKLPKREDAPVTPSDEGELNPDDLPF